MGNQQMYTDVNRCKLSGVWDGEEKGDEILDKRSKEDDSDANSKSIQPDFTHQQKRKRPAAWSFTKKEEEKIS